MSFDQEKLIRTLQADREKQLAEDADRLADLSGIEKAIGDALQIIANNLSEEATKQATTHLRFALLKVQRLRSESEDQPESL